MSTNPAQIQIDSMIKSLGGPVKKSEESPKEPVVEVTPEVEKEEVVEPEVTPEPEVEPELEPEPEKVEVVDPKDQEIINLKAQLEELKSPKPVEKVEDKPVIQPEPDKPVDFLNGMDFDDVTRDPEALNKFANQIYTKGLAGAADRVLAQVPALVQQQVAIQRQMEKTREEFFTDNPDLDKFPKVVATVFGEIQGKNKDKPFDEILKMTASEVRTRLGLKVDEVKPDDKKHKAPKLPSGGGKGGRSTGEPVKENSLTSEIAEMNKVIR
jgi:hypothetical protein